ncbi:MAG TPA: SUMF1/EgtB/PvdO family nonheme iron enzyme [Candidatus Glassbacteria bacterium]|nr:SUMF1/EgtB/PvdO family nonheme iron enzyme [Candidatus Glassbacteria bacterium]
MSGLRMPAIFLLLFAAFRFSIAQEKFVTLGPAAYTVTDEVTGIELEVSLDEFVIGATEVTQAQFQETLGCNPSHFRGDHRPVENVSWSDAIRYCNARSLAESLAPCYDLATGTCDLRANGWRLPTDAEWSLAYGSPAQGQDIQHTANIGSANTKSLDVLRAETKEKSTQPVGSFPANANGLFDMPGNVWEWTGDWVYRTNHPLRLHNPVGPPRGVAKLIRGGSFFSLSNNWGRGYRSSMPPEHKSRFTGFRLCRSTGRQYSRSYTDPAWYEPYNRAPAGYENTLGPLTDLLASGEPTVATWEKKRAQIRGKWLELLGTIPGNPPAPAVREAESVEDPLFSGKLLYLQTESDSWEKVFLMLPRRPLVKPSPTIIVPYYDVDTPAGTELGGRSYMPPSVRSFAYVAVQQGWIAVAVRWYGESYAEGYGEAVYTLKERHPGLSGLGKWVWDSQRLLDWLETLPEVDQDRIGIIGHSLGGKMSLYAAAFDTRIDVAVSSELGLGIDDSNYEDYWYFDQRITGHGATDHHELLGLIAPRPFLLIGGDEYDKERSWYFINAGRKIYGLYGDPMQIGYFNHHTGHTPSPESVSLALKWFQRFLEDRQ